jgi:hypothetical protein
VSSYVKLTRKKRTFAGFSQAWLGSDHLLVVHSIRFVERYQRFALSDIQAIVVSEGGRRAVWQGLIVLLCLSTGLSARSTFGRGFFAVVGAIALLLAILDIARGPRCRCFLQTAVSRERLASVSRMRTARSFIATITPAIESVQGAIPAEELAESRAAMISLPVDLAKPISQPPALVRTPGYAPEVLFGVLMLDSLLVFVGLRSNMGVALTLLPTIYFAEFLIGIVALVQSRARNATTLAVLIAAFLCVLIDPFALSGTAVWPGLFDAMRQASSSSPPWNLAIAASAMTMLLATGWRALMAVTGLGVCHFERTRGN